MWFLNVSFVSSVISEPLQNYKGGLLCDRIISGCGRLAFREGLKIILLFLAGFSFVPQRWKQDKIPSRSALRWVETRYTVRIRNRAESGSIASIGHQVRGSAMPHITCMKIKGTGIRALPWGTPHFCTYKVVIVSIDGLFWLQSVRKYKMNHR